VINSFSKYFCMTGWRVGWMVAPEPLVRYTPLQYGPKSEAVITQYDMKAVGDIGLLKIDRNKLASVEVVSSEKCVVGQEAFTVSSLGGEKRCADCGIITYLGPFDAVWEFMLDKCVSVTASSLNIGMSGGPICNLQAQVVGISYLNFADLSRAILAIPGECFILSRDELVRHGRRVSVPSRLWLGVLSYTLREHVVIAGVMPGSPGEKAGLKQGDVVLILAYTGLRFGELTGLNVEDVDLQARRIRVRRSITQLSGQLLEGPPKSRAGRRSVPIPERLVPILQRRTQGRTAGEPAIMSPKGARLGLENWKRAVGWRIRIAELGRPTMRLHDYADLRVMPTWVRSSLWRRESRLMRSA